MVYLVTWNLNKEGSLYSVAREKFLSGFAGLDWIHESNLDTVAFVNTLLTATQLDARLRANIDTNDRIFVCALDSSDYSGRFDTNVVSWLDAKL